MNAFTFNDNPSVSEMMDSLDIELTIIQADPITKISPEDFRQQALNHMNALEEAVDINDDALILEGNLSFKDGWYAELINGMNLTDENPDVIKLGSPFKNHRDTNVQNMYVVLDDRAIHAYVIKQNKLQTVIDSVQKYIDAEKQFPLPFGAWFSIDKLKVLAFDPPLAWTT